MDDSWLPKGTTLLKVLGPFENTSLEDRFSDASRRDSALSFRVHGVEPVVLRTLTTPQLLRQLPAQSIQVRVGVQATQSKASQFKTSAPHLLRSRGQPG